MKKEVFIYNATKLYQFLEKEFSKIKNKLTTNADDISSLKDTTSNINTNVTKNTEDIKSVSDTVTDLKNKADNGDFGNTTIENTNVSGDILNINNVKQHVFKNIKAGETIEVPNEGVGTDFIVQCYEQSISEEPILVRSIDITPENKDLFEYDERYVTIDETGAHPKNEIDIPMELREVKNGMSICVSTETFPVELLESINNIYDYSITEKVSNE